MIKFLSFLGTNKYEVCNYLYQTGDGSLINNLTLSGVKAIDREILKSGENKEDDINHAGWQKNPRNETSFKDELDLFIRAAESIILKAPLEAKPKEEAIPREKRQKMLLIFSHDITEEQETDAKRDFGVEEFISLPPALQDKWSDIPAQMESLDEYMRDMLNWIDENAAPGDYALVEGDFGATHMVVCHCKKKGIIPVYSTTERKVTQEHLDGEVITRRSFRHVRFRVYGE